MSVEFNLRISLGNDAMKTPEDVAAALIDAAAAINQRGLPKGDEGYRILDANGLRVGDWKTQRFDVRDRPGYTGAVRRADGLRSRETVIRLMALLGANDEWDSAADYLEMIAEELNSRHGSYLGFVSDIGEQHDGTRAQWIDIADELGIARTED
jgi:hypothetical protein